ncbi:MAG: hypothetical protein R3E53_14905 [Myxococcota bacterium]
MSRSGESATDGAPGRRRGAMRRAGGLLLLGLAVGGVVALAVRDVESRRIAHAERAARALAGRAEVARRLFASEDARLVSELARVRVELRDQALWPGLEGLLDESGRLDTRGVGGRRLHALLSQALEQDDRLVGFDLVVAGHGGLVSLRFPDEGGVDGRPGADSEGTDPARLREGRAKALWYGDEVSRAVASNGRAVERGEVGFEGAGDVERAMLGMAIGLHAPGELVQGALRARIDVGRIAAGFERLAGPGDALAVVLLDGRRVDAAGRLPGSAPDPRLAAWAARVAGPTAGESSFEDEGRLVHASPLTTADGGIAHLLLLQETPSAATGAAAWLASPWPIVLAVLVGVALVASALMLRPASAAGTVAGSAGVGADDGIRVAPRDFVLREWLADVRGCLERGAATRGWCSTCAASDRSRRSSSRIRPGSAG